MLRRLPASLVVLVLCLAQWTAMCPAWAWCPPATSITINYPSTNSRYRFDDGSPGEVGVGSNATADPDCNNPRIEWSCEDISGTQEIWNPDPPKGATVSLKLSGLPSQNNQFGNTWVRARIPEDSVSDTNTFRLFFTEEATNHPDGGTPNWYYYWEQTSAEYGSHTYNAGFATGKTTFAGGAWVSYIGYDANEYSPAGTWSNAEGIDFYAHLCRHEERHRLDMISLWGAGSDRDPANDGDADYLPSNQESVLGAPYHQGGYDPTKFATFADHFDYGAGWSDCEDYCMHREEAWANGSADTSDWAAPGHQW